MRAIVFGDSHIANDNNLANITKLCNIIKYNSPELVVLNGDIFDPWKNTWEAIEDLDSYKAINNMVMNRAGKGLPTIYNKGNHDWQVPESILPAAIKEIGYEIDIDGFHYLFSHGWIWDVIWGDLPIHAIAFFIARRFPWLMIPIYNFLFKHKLPSVKKSAAGGKTRLMEQVNDCGALEEALQDWNLHSATIQLRAAKYAFKKKCRVVMNHTHSPMAFNGLVVDTGDMEDSNTYIDILNGVVVLKKV